MEEERDRRLDPENRPDGAEIDNTDRDFDVDKGMFTDSEDYDEVDPAYKDPEDPNSDASPDDAAEGADADDDGATTAPPRTPTTPTRRRTPEGPPHRLGRLDRQRAAPRPHRARPRGRRRRPAGPRGRPRRWTAPTPWPSTRRSPRSRPDAVVHLAGIPTESSLPDALNSHVVSTGALLEAMVRHGVRRLVYASSNHAVGRTPRADLPGGVLGADVRGRPDTFYGVAKVAAEALLQLYADRHGLDVVSTRIGSFLPAAHHPSPALVVALPRRRGPDGRTPP